MSIDRRDSQAEPEPDLPAFVTNLIFALRDLGFLVDTRQAIATERLLWSLGPHLREPGFDLAAHLGPIFCRTDDEQKRLRDILPGVTLVKREVFNQPPAIQPVVTPTIAPPVQPGWNAGTRSMFVVLLLLPIIIGIAARSIPNVTFKKPVVTQPPKPDRGRTLPDDKPKFDPRTSDAAPMGMFSYRRIALHRPVAPSSSRIWLLPVIPLAGALLWILLRHSRRPRLRRESTELPQAFREVRLPGGPRDPFSRLRVRELSRSLRIRQRVASRELHLDATIARTIENGGRLTPVFESIVEPSYLVLIDRASSSDHFGRLADELLATLRLGNVDVESFEFDRNPTYCNLHASSRRSSDKFRFRLTEVLDLYPDRPLLILSDGGSFLHPFTDAPPQWFDWVADRRRVLVTPASDKLDWTTRERKLRRHGFQIAPMTPMGLPSIATILAGLEVPVRRDERIEYSFEAESDRCLSIFKPPEDYIQSLCDELKSHLESDGFMWLASLAAYPELHWGLTLRFGASLIEDEERWELLLPRLARLVWLRQGFMPDWLREALLSSLTPEDETTIRQLLLKFLSDGYEKTNDQSALREIPLRIVIDTPRNPWTWIKDSYTRLWTTRRQSKERLDVVYLRFLLGRGPRWLAPYVPNSLLKLLFSQGAWIFGLRTGLVMSVCITFAMIPFFGIASSRSRGLQIQSIEMTHNGERLITQHADRSTREWSSRVLYKSLEGHRSAVESVAWSRNGQQIVTGSSDNTARIWDSRTGQSLLEPKRLPRISSSVAFSPDVQRIITCSDDGTVQLWDLGKGEPLMVLQHIGRVSSVAFSPDGERIITGCDDGTVRLWGTGKIEPLLVLKQPDRVLSIAISPDGKTIIAGSNDMTARLWNIRSTEPLFVLKGHKGGVSSVGFSPDGRRIVTGSHDNSARIWDSGTGQPVLELKGHTSSVLSVNFSPSGQQVVTGSQDNTARIWDSDTSQPVLELKGHRGSILSAAFSPDGQQVVTGSHDNTARIWDLRVHDYDRTLGSNRQFLAVSEDGQRFAEKAVDGAVDLYELGRPEPILHLPSEQSGNVCLLSDSGTTLVVGRTGGVSIHHTRDNSSNAQTFPTQLTSPIGIAWGSHGEIIMWDDSGHLCVIDSSVDGAGVVNFSIPRSIVGHVQSDDRRFVAFWGASDSALLLDTDSLQFVRLATATGRVSGVAICPKEEELFVWDDAGNGEIVLYEKEFNVAPSQSGSLQKQTYWNFSGTRRIISAGLTDSEHLWVHADDGRLSFFNVPFGAKKLPNPVGRAFATAENVKQVAGGDGHKLAVVSNDGSVRIWDGIFGVPLSDPLTTSGKIKFATFGRPAAPPQAPAVATTGPIRESQALALATETGNVEVWELNNSGRGVALLVDGREPEGVHSDEVMYLDEVLTRRFGFEVTRLQRPTREEIQTTWEKLRLSLTQQDRFLLVISGLGGAGTGQGGGFVFFPNAGNEELTADEIRTYVDDVRAQQSLLIIDVTGSGLLIERSIPRLEMAAPQSDVLSRLVLSSGTSTESWWRGNDRKLLSPIRELLSGERPLEKPQNGVIESARPFTADELFKNAALIVAQNEELGVVGVFTGPIELGPLKGSRNTPRSMFYFPAPRRLTINKAGLVNKAHEVIQAGKEMILGPKKEDKDLPKEIKAAK